MHVSTFGTHSMPARQAAYTSTKQAAMTASKTLAKELGAQGTRVNVVTPGYITGEPLDQLFQGVSDRTGESIEAVSARMAKTAALRRHVIPRTSRRPCCSSAPTGVGVSPGWRSLSPPVSTRSSGSRRRGLRCR